MTVQEANEIKELVALTSVTMAQKNKCEELIQKWISPGYKFCKTCDPAVRTAFKKLKTWWEQEQLKPLRSIKTKK